MSRWAAPGPLLAGLAALLLALLVVFTYVAVDQRAEAADLAAEERTDEEVVAAARKAALAFTNVDYREIDADIDAVLDTATEEFAAEFRGASPQLKQLTRRAKSVSEGEIVEAGLVSRDGDSARAIVVADTRVTNRSIKQAQPRYFRLQLDLVEQDGVWLTRKLEFVG